MTTELKPENEFNAKRRDYGLSHWARDADGRLYFVGARVPPTPGPIPPDLLADPRRDWVDVAPKQ